MRGEIAPGLSGPLTLWSLAAGAALWAPALGIRMGGVMLQPMDLVALAAWPVVLTYLFRVPAAAAGLGALFVLSSSMSFLLAGRTPGGALVLVWYVGFLLPTLGGLALMAVSPAARQGFVLAFLAAAVASALLFLAQIAFGARVLDFRTNSAFNLPLQYGRGFALFPEVSTFAAHGVATFGMALALALHPGATRALRTALAAFLVLLSVALVFSRSSAVPAIAPVLILAALAATAPRDLRGLLPILCAAALGGIALGLVFSSLYEARIENAAATRSIEMRAASILGGLTPLVRGELFGVGLGENHEITRRAYDISRAWGFRFGALPEGVNSLIVARIFEEGWTAVLHALAGFWLLVRVLPGRDRDPFVTALAVLALASLMTSAAVTGYRGIYTGWLWLALPAGLLLAMHRPDRRTRAHAA